LPAAAVLVVATPKAEAASTDALITEVIFMTSLIPPSTMGVNYQSVI